MSLPWKGYDVKIGCTIENCMVVRNRLLRHVKLYMNYLKKLVGTRVKRSVDEPQSLLIVTGLIAIAF